MDEISDRISKDLIGKKQLDIVERMLKNSTALLFASLVAKGSGLVVAVLIARYLDPTAFGAFTVVMGLALLLEPIIPLGQRVTLIREIARDDSRLYPLWLNASVVTCISSLLVSILLVGFVRLAGYDTSILPSVYVAALFLPAGSLLIVTRAVLQGMERMEWFTAGAFIGQVLNVLVLWSLLEMGAGLIAAFVGRSLALVVSLLILSIGVLRQRKGLEFVQRWRPDLKAGLRFVRLSFPFAVKDALVAAMNQVNAIVLPPLITLEALGLFGAASRIQSASAMILPLVTSAILPNLSRLFITDRKASMVLTEKALKLMMVMILPFVFIVFVIAERMIPLLYGVEYEGAVPILRVLIWTQVFLAADVILNQVMIATGNEKPMVRRVAISLISNVMFILFLAPRYGALGAAWAAVLTQVLNLSLDVQFVFTRILHVDLVDTVGKPVICAVGSAIIALALRNQTLYILGSAVMLSYLVLLILLVFSSEELYLLYQLCVRLRNRVGTIVPSKREDF